MQRIVRYALIDLLNRTAAVKEVSAGQFGCWSLHFEEMRFLWELDPEAVAFSTGPLTGTGVPGSGAMVWSCLRRGAVHHAAAEGRFGAALRCAGIDMLFITGSSPQPLRLRICQGEITFENPVGNASSLLAVRRFEDAALLTVSRESVTEDRCFVIAGEHIAQRLLNKGICAVIAEGDGAIPLADSRRFTPLCVELWQEAIRSRNLPQSGRSRPVQFLSAGCLVSLEVPASSPFDGGGDPVFAALGVAWNKTGFSASKPKQRLAQLLTACLGEPCTPEELTALSKHLKALERRNLTRGTV